ncbi:MAG: leucyl aminopeptidase [Candidatus Doudnabacteria bacterium]|nr:leucyl aminopeptidase [Candidatus Doudnabacteria bacterium]
MITLTKKLPNNLDLIILPVFADQDFVASLKPLVKDAGLLNLVKQDYKNKFGTTYLVYPNTDECQRLLLVGLGKKSLFSQAAWRQAIQTAVSACQNLGVENIGLVLPVIKKPDLASYLELTGFALTFGTYKFTYYKQEDSKEKKKTLENVYVLAKTTAVTLLKALEQGTNIGLAANNARDLANHPGNVATPTHLAAHATKLAKKYRFKIRVLNPAQIKKEGMGLLMGVSAGSDEPPRFIVMEYLPPGKKTLKQSQPIVLVGKGLTFDSGGISIKPSEKLEEMKYDMCGGATVLGIFEAVASMKLPIHLVGLVPASENLLSGKAVKPGDILRSHSGKTVEVINTDAEGRLILADAISYAKKHYDPQLIVDYATLTGAVVVALGSDYTGYFTNRASTFDSTIKQASKQSSELYWPLPLAPSYKDQLKSQTADIKNVAENSHAGSSTAALFLASFVGETPWIHLDIAGTAWNTRPKPHLPAGATGWGVYFTLNFLRQIK